MSGRFWRAAIFGVCNIAVIAYLAADFSRAYDAAAAPSQATTYQNSTSPEYSNEQLNALVKLIDIHRSEIGATTLVRDPALDKIAEARAQDMADKAYYAHQSPDGRFFSDLMDEAKTSYAFACENLNMAEQSDPQAFYDSWLTSEGHKACLENSDVQRVGYATTKVLVSNGIPISQHIVVAIYVQSDK